MHYIVNNPAVKKTIVHFFLCSCINASIAKPVLSKSVGCFFSNGRHGVARNVLHILLGPGLPPYLLMMTCSFQQKSMGAH